MNSSRKLEKNVYFLEWSIKVCRVLNQINFLKKIHTTLFGRYLNLNMKYNSGIRHLDPILALFAYRSVHDEIHHDPTSHISLFIKLVVEDTLNFFYNLQTNVFEINASFQWWARESKKMCGIVSISVLAVDVNNGFVSMAFAQEK